MLLAGCGPQAAPRQAATATPVLKALPVPTGTWPAPAPTGGPATLMPVPTGNALLPLPPPTVPPALPPSGPIPGPDAFYARLTFTPTLAVPDFIILAHRTGLTVRDVVTRGGNPTIYV